MMLKLKNKKLEVDDLRKFCANKRYVIHKIEGEKVYFGIILLKNKLGNILLNH